MQLADNFNDYLPTLDGDSKIIKSDKDFYTFAEGVFRLKNVMKKEVHFNVSTVSNVSQIPFVPIMQRKGIMLFSKQKNDIKKMILGDRLVEQLTDQERLDLVINFFKNRHFLYSLSPPPYSSTEDFILNGKLGYCSHFAGALVYMAKAVNLPSRIIMGYQGGEYNPFDQSLIVRELDGHAWAEVYLSNLGWKRIDPTSFVAPSRTTVGASAFNDQLSPSLISKSFFNFKFLNTASLWVDSLNYQFNESLTNFDKEEQLKTLQKFLSNMYSVESMFALSIVVPLFCIYLGFYFYTKEKVSIEEKRYRNFLKKMQRYGYTKHSSETASAFSARCLASKNTPAKLTPIISVETKVYIEAFYKT